MGAGTPGAKCPSFPGIPLAVLSPSFAAEVDPGVRQGKRPTAGRVVAQRESLLQQVLRPIFLCEVRKAFVPAWGPVSPRACTAPVVPVCRRRQPWSSRTAPHCPRHLRPLTGLFLLLIWSWDVFPTSLHPASGSSSMPSHSSPEIILFSFLSPVRGSPSFAPERSPLPCPQPVPG